MHNVKKWFETLCTLAVFVSRFLNNKPDNFEMLYIKELINGWTLHFSTGAI